MGDCGVRGLVRQWIHFLRLFAVALSRLRSTRNFGFFWFAPGFVPGFSLCLVRQWLHILRQFARWSRRLRSTRKLGSF